MHVLDVRLAYNCWVLKLVVLAEQDEVLAHQVVVHVIHMRTPAMVPGI